MSALPFKRGDRIYRFALWNSSTGQFSYSEWIVKKIGPYQMTLVSPADPSLTSFVKHHSASHEKRFELKDNVPDPVAYGVGMSIAWIKHRCTEYEQQLNMRDTSNLFYICTRADLDNLKAHKPSCGEYNELRIALNKSMREGL